MLRETCIIGGLRHLRIVPRVDLGDDHAACERNKRRDNPKDRRFHHSPAFRRVNPAPPSRANIAVALTGLCPSIRERARELGLSDAEVARRAGLSERRYGYYATGEREPNLATYTFDGARLVTRVDATSDPSRVGSDQERGVRFEGEHMVLIPPPRRTGESEEHREITWERIAVE